jgi:hypothetical protein
MRWTKEGKSELGVAGKRVASAGVKRGGGGGSCRHFQIFIT